MRKTAGRKASGRRSSDARLARALGPGVAERTGDRRRIVDTGIGIRAEDLATLFRPVRRIDDGTARHHDGAGLGLSIIRNLAELLGGSIDVQDEPGRGRTFTVVLPLRKKTP